MAELFRSAKSAFSYISSGIGGTGGEDERGSELIGEIVELGDLKLKVQKVIAEGGYGFVYVAVDTAGKEYAIKRQVVPVDQMKTVKQEVSFLKQLKGHAHIIEFIGALGTPPKQGAAELIIVTELVTGGNMADIVNYQRLSPRQVLRVFHETCLAVAHMHSKKPPIIHRDLKVENLLLTKDKRIKLCDFGSATTNQVLPDHTWSATQRGLAEDEVQRNTTPMYRSPEMIDLYSNNPINEKSDIWALGCLLFKLCYQEHPFEDSAKLRILNANYHIPSNDVAYSLFHGIIRECLVVEPQKRPSADALIAQLYSIADKLGEDLNGAHKEPLEFLLLDHPGSHSTEHDSIVGSTIQNTSQQAHKFFGIMKGGAENLFKNIKDTSNKVISTVQGGQHSRPLDISYITSRILVMSFPYEEPLQPYQNTIGEVGAYLEETHPSQYLIFNLSGEQYDVTKLNGQVVDYEWPFKVLPPLESLVELCRQMDSWLRADSQNVLVIHCKDGIHPSIVLVTTYLLFLRALPSPQTAIRMFAAKRLPEGQGIQLTASEKRYLKYMSELVAPTPFKPHSHSLYILMLKLSSVPMYNDSRNGCKPFVEIYIDGERVFTSCTKDNMGSMRTFTTTDGCVEIPVGVSVCGNLHVVVHHIKSVPSASNKSSGMGMSAVKMFHLQFHSGFVPLDSTSLSFNRNELDGPAAKRQERFPNPFKVTFDLQVESTQQSQGDIAWQQLPHPQAYPITCYTTIQEQEEVLDIFGRQKKSKVGAKVTSVKPDEGYSQMKNEDNVAVADLLGGTGSGSGDGSGSGVTSSTHDNVLYSEYTPYRDTADIDSESSSSSSSSDSSSSSNDDQHKGNQFDPFSQYKPMNNESTHSTTSNAGPTRDFFSNPNAGGIEEANLLGFSIEDNTPEDHPQVQPQQNQNDPFGAMWDSMANTTAQSSSSNEPFSIFDSEPSNTPSMSTLAPTPSSGTANVLTPSIATAPTPSSSSDFDPFGIWDKSNKTPEETTPVSSSNSTNEVQFDPFAPNESVFKPQSSSRQTSTSSVGGQHTSAQPTAYTRHSSYGDTQQPLNKSRNDQFGWSQAGTQKSSDPFAGLGSFGTSNPGSSQPMGTASSRPQPSMNNRQTYQSGNMGFKSDTQGSSLNVPGSSGGSRPGSRPASRPASRPGSRPPSGGGIDSSGRPRSVSPNDTKPTKRGSNTSTGMPSKSTFDDLLDQNLFTNKNKPDDNSTPLNSLQGKKKIEQITDPDQRKVFEWADGKEHNIRALLSSLHTILWEGETRWKPVGIHQLVEGDTVGKFFRKACLSVHPDKVDQNNANLARAIFDELNDAYELFEASGSKSLY